MFGWLARMIERLPYVLERAPEIIESASPANDNCMYPPLQCPDAERLGFEVHMNLPGHPGLCFRCPKCSRVL